MSSNQLNIDQKKRMAYSMYMLYEKQYVICDKDEGVGISENTLSKWIKEGKWDKLRATKSVSKNELKQRIYGLIAEVIENAIENQNYDSIGDELSKLRSTIDKLGNEVGAEESIEVSIGFSNWLVSRMNIDDEIDMDFIKKVSRFLNEYVKTLL